MATQSRKRTTSSAGSPPLAERWASTLEECLADQAGWQHAEFESGLRLTFRMATLGELIAAGELPDDLMQLALLEYGEPGAAGRLMAETVDVPDEAAEEELGAAVEAAKEIGRKLVRINHELCALAIIEPKLTAEQVAALPFGDLELLSGFLTRRAIFDAAGRRVGVEPLDTFRVFAEEHGHDSAACEGCAAARQRMATAAGSR